MASNLRTLASAARGQAGGATLVDVGTPAYHQAVADYIRRELAPLPFAVIENDIKGSKASAELIGEGLIRVNLAVWHSGVDTALFGRQVQRTAAGQPALIAFDKTSRPAQTELHPIPPALVAKLPQLMARSKGFSDLQANIDSPEASQVKQQLSTLAPDQYKSVIEEIGLIGNYEHGTHVAGIAIAGNPHARLVRCAPGAVGHVDGVASGGQLGGQDAGGGAQADTRGADRAHHQHGRPQ